MGLTPVNAWNRLSSPIADFLPRFCAARYGAQAEKFRRAYEAVIPISILRDWSGNCGFALTKSDGRAWPWEHEKFEKPDDEWERCLVTAPEALRLVSQLDGADAFTARDAIDLERTVLDRLLLFRWRRYLKTFAAWRKGGPSDTLEVQGREIVSLLGRFADLLSRHSDYSLWESYRRLDAVEKVRNPNFPQILLENASCEYCRGHQAEFARQFYLPHVKKVVSNIDARVRVLDRSSRPLPNAETELAEILKRPLSTL